MGFGSVLEWYRNENRGKLSHSSGVIDTCTCTYIYQCWFACECIVCGSTHCCGHVVNGTVAFKEDKVFS